MEEKDIVSVLSEQGWVCSKDEAGDYFCVTDVGGVQLQVIPSVVSARTIFGFRLSPPFHPKNFRRPFFYIR
ncbi:DUF6990 domain-containing protein [Pseudomonas sp. FW300-N2F2]|uniref:DUF6990 domain-containing protein n=1 Tax=Pseudomonas sp. FW300-N2F2 TaxID=2751320 RepID=UPI0038571F4B